MTAKWETWYRTAHMSTYLATCCAGRLAPLVFMKFFPSHNRFQVTAGCRHRMLKERWWVHGGYGEDG